MIRYIDTPVIISGGKPVETLIITPECKKKTLANTILSAHNVNGERGPMRIRFDAMISHDITYVGIVQTARASGLTEFPIPYALTNCHNSLCAVGG
ncbi:MAG: hydratase, partial [Oscillospiraceae bacterium]